MLQRRPTDPGPHQATWQIEHVGDRWVIWLAGGDAQTTRAAEGER